MLYSTMQLSIIINTIDRPKVLKDCLESLLTQTDNNFEVIVVDQSIDNKTESLCSRYELRYQRSNLRNLSVSRNLGIGMASGELIAFIDDDAKAEEHWVARIKLAFRNDPEISCVAGKVIDCSENKPVVQFENGTVSQYGNIYEIRDPKEEEFNVGKEEWYSRPMGANMAFNKNQVIDVGGFDEYFEYIHEETDLALRLIRNGGKVVYRPKVLVDHYPARSHNRESKYKLNRFAEAKNNVYFGMKNGRNNLFVRTFRSMYRVWNPVGPVRNVYKLWRDGKISLGEAIKSWISIDKGITHGWFAGAFRARKFQKFEEKSEMEFLRFKEIVSP